MSENTVTGLVEELRALLHDPYEKPIKVGMGTREHLHSEPVCAFPECIRCFSPHEYVVERLLAILDAHASRPWDDGALGSLGHLIPDLASRRHFSEIIAVAVLDDGYLSPADVERVVAAAKAEAWDEGAAHSDSRGVYAPEENPYVVACTCTAAALQGLPYDPACEVHFAGPERRTEPNEAVSADD